MSNRSALKPGMMSGNTTAWPLGAVLVAEGDLESVYSSSQCGLVWLTLVSRTSVKVLGPAVSGGWR